MSNNLPKRRRIFIKKSFQARFMVGAFAVILLSGLCSAALIYWLTNDVLRAQSLSVHVSIMNTWERLGMSILLGNFVATLVAGTVAVISVLYASHKIAGPLHRFERLCAEIGNGNFEGVARLREMDQLHDLAEAFTAMMAKLRSRRDRQAGLLADIDSRIVHLQNGDNLTEEQRLALAALAEVVARASGQDED